MGRATGLVGREGGPFSVFRQGSMMRSDSCFEKTLLAAVLSTDGRGTMWMLVHWRGGHSGHPGEGSQASSTTHRAV